MKKVSLLATAVLIHTLILAQYTPADSGSAVQFSIKNFGINTGGSFSGLQGTIVFDATHINHASFDVSVDAASVNTDNTLRDDHLRAATYFDVLQYPRIRFISTKVTASTKAGVLFIFGKLTIKGVTKEISFPFTATPAAGGYLFKGTFTINRKDFTIGGSSVISDNLQVQLSVLAKK